MSTEIFCFDHESKQFQSISRIEPATRWASSILGSVINVIQIECSPDDEHTEVRIIASEMTPEEAFIPTPGMLDDIDPDSAWLEQMADPHTNVVLNISNPANPGKGATIFIRHREPQDWQHN